MSPKRGDDVAPPPIDGEWRLKFATTEAARGWVDLCGEAPGNTRRCFEALRSDPTSMAEPDRQHRVRGRLSKGVLHGIEFQQQGEYEVTSGGRIRYIVDGEKHTVHLVYASPRHPKDTDS